MAEVAVRTEADRKGGHLVRSRRTGRLMLREMSQVHPEDRAHAQDIGRHPYFNTNSLWIRIDALRDLLASHHGVLPLPVIFLLMFLCAFAGAGLIAHALSLLVRRAAALQQESELTI